MPKITVSPVTHRRLRDYARTYGAGFSSHWKLRGRDTIEMELSDEVYAAIQEMAKKFNCTEEQAINLALNKALNR